MKRPSFIEGVMLALVASITGNIFYKVLTTMLPSGLVLHLLITGISLGYVLYLLNRSGESTGRITSFTGWLLMTVVGWTMLPSVTSYLLLQVGLIWLIRSLYFHSNLLSTLSDLVLQALSLTTAVWAVHQTGSLLPGIWCFFLIQALFAAIPAGRARKPGPDGGDQIDQEQFHRAHRAAESALRKLSSIH